MSSFHLYLNRLLAEWRFQFGVLRSVADWTIVLYIILPVTFAVLFIYRSWWLESPDWIAWVPTSLFFLLGYVLTWLGQYRTFVLEGDKVFLIKNKKMFKGIKNWGMFYTWLARTVTMLFITAVILPLFMNYYHFSVNQILAYFLFFLSMNIIVLHIKLTLRRIQGTIIRLIITVFTFLVVGSFVPLFYHQWLNESMFFSLLFIITVMGSSMIHYCKSLNKISRFDSEVSIERKERLKYIELIYQMSYEIEKTTVVTRKKPLLYRNSKPIFQNRTGLNGFSELFLKVFIRNSAFWFTYIQLILVTITAIIVVPPIWIKIVMIIGFIIMMLSWLRSVWDRITLSHPMTKKYIEHEELFLAKKRMIYSLFSLSIILLTVISFIGFKVLSIFA